MLAQSFLTADQLGITEPQRDALQKTLVLLETDKLTHIPEFVARRIQSVDFTGHFNMRSWSADSDCGTVRCIGGTAEAITLNFGLFRGWGDTDNPLHDLFAPSRDEFEWEQITPAQAATALRSYLTTGNANWKEAIRWPTLPS